MTVHARKARIEFGDFQTPDELARAVCVKLKKIGLEPQFIIEPTCGVGAFVMAAIHEFPSAMIFGFDINKYYLDTLASKLSAQKKDAQIQLRQADFFGSEWKISLQQHAGPVLIIGNFPWVTNSGLGVIEGTNLPEKTNFLGHSGFEAISGKSNFDISEWMLLDVLKSLKGRTADIAMLVKTSVARKVLAHVARQGDPVYDAALFGIDAKKSFGASVDACLMLMRLDPTKEISSDYVIYPDLEASTGVRVGHRNGLTIGNLEKFERSSFLLGKSPERWRSGVKHDAASVMEFTLTDEGYKNGLGEIVQLEDTYLFPLLKGSDIGSNKEWRSKFVLVTQCHVGEDTSLIKHQAPKTWRYLVDHGEQLDARGSIIYAKNPRFSVFGIGDYAFRPWRIAICGLYKKLEFRLVAPMSGRPVMFDDTVYYLSFDTEAEAISTLEVLQSSSATDFLSSLIFWDEKRPIKTGILNLLDWSKAMDMPCNQLVLV